jgi:Mn-dependent DtxR family transcriptional regulator
MPRGQVHAEAERLEHVLPEELEERIAAKLGQPTRDPHGDPIPQRDGTRSGAGRGRADRSAARGGRRHTSVRRMHAGWHARR